MEHSRIIIGYHGCLEPLASDLLTGARSVEEWKPSDKNHEWLGRGIYFWEHAPLRAWEWAVDKAKEKGGDARPAVIGAMISLAGCFDLTEIHFTQTLRRSFDILSESAKVAGTTLPINANGRNKLDCLVINYAADLTQGAVKSVRCPFHEGGEAFPGSAITAKGHVQIAVRDRVCILGLFRPNVPSGGELWEPTTHLPIG